MGCATSGGFSQPQPLRLSQVAGQGDAARVASMRFVQSGLRADDSGQTRQALGDFERALQIDPGNPVAYLALSRHEVFAGDPQRGLDVLDKAQSLLETDPEGPAAAPHLDGLRGAALRELGRRNEAQPLLSSARELAPGVWGDGVLDAYELW
jgi:tetratricopeptide (TPR) repeat protein